MIIEPCNLMGLTYAEWLERVRDYFDRRGVPSLDSGDDAYDAWGAGETPPAYAQSIIQRDALQPTD